MFRNIFSYLLFILSAFLPQTRCHPILIVISFDGFRNDYVNQNLTPNLFKLASDGVRAHMISSFVTKTYPNHQSIATGYYEEVHGIINNHMFDPVFNETFDVDKSADRWWNQSPALPIWIVNQMETDGEPRASASMQWPGSHVSYNNQAVHYNHGYDSKLSWDKRIDIIIEWMTSTEKTKANCVFTYFEDPDVMAHKFGPFSPQVYKEVIRADNTIGYLIKRLEEKGLRDRTNLIILSDHGMAEISSDRVIYLDTLLNSSWYDIYGASPVWSILPKPGLEDQVYSKLLNASKNMNFKVYKKEEIPQEFHYRSHRRILPIFLMANEGWDIFQSSKTSWITNGTTVWGNHGYNNSLPSMRPLFIANGPAFKSNYEHKKQFQNVDLYPLMLNVLQLFPTKQFPSNGSFVNVYDLLIPPIGAGGYDTSAQKWFNFILYVFGGFGILFFGSVCLICCTNLGKTMTKQRPPDIVWDSLGSGIDIDLRSHLDPNVNDFSKPLDDDIISRAKRLQRPEETLLLLEDDDEEDL